MGSFSLTPYLLCTLGLLIVVQVGALESCSNNGQTFACLHLVGQGEQTRLLYILLGICANQYEQLGPEERGDSLLKKIKNTRKDKAEGKRCRGGRVLQNQIKL